MRAERPNITNIELCKRLFWLTARDLETKIKYFFIKSKIAYSGLWNINKNNEYRKLIFDNKHIIISINRQYTVLVHNNYVQGVTTLISLPDNILALPH